MRVVAILGPSQSGKTEVVARLAGLEGGAVQREEAGPLALTAFSFLGEAWGALDLAGGADWAAMAGPALLAADAAVVVVPPDPEAAALAAPYLRAVERAGTPALILVNRMDTCTARLRDIVAALQAYSGHVLTLRQVPIREGGRVVGAVDLISERAWRYREGQVSQLVELPVDLVGREHEAREDLIEHMADFDEALLEELVEDRVPPTAALFSIAAREFAEAQVVPVLMGAASHGNGMLRLMKALRHETPAVGALRARLGGEATAVSFHAEHRKHLGKVVWLRALSDGVAQGGRLAGGSVGGLLAPGGHGAPSPLPAGAVALAVKADQLSAGRLAGPDRLADPPNWARVPAPMLGRRLAPQSIRP